MVKGVIFDFDGVIIDSEPLRYKSYKKLFLNEFHIHLPDGYTSILGRKQEDNIKHFLDTFELKGDINELIKKREVILRDIFKQEENIIPIKGVVTFIKFLKKNKIKVAIASSSSLKYLRHIIKYLKIGNLLDVIVPGGAVNKGKPEPYIFLLAIKKLGLTKQECIIIEDSLNGVYAAKNAGIKCFAITSSLKKEKLKEADFIFEDFEQKEIFKKIIE